MARTEHRTNTFAAFHQICKNAQMPKGGVYCSLYSVENRYGGPEEGGWWYDDYTLIATEHFPTEELAEEARDKIRTMAREMTEDAARDHCRQMAESCDWLESRGLDADYLSEPDGPTVYSVLIEQTPGDRETTERPHYE